MDAAALEAQVAFLQDRKEAVATRLRQKVDAEGRCILPPSAQKACEEECASPTFSSDARPYPPIPQARSLWSEEAPEPPPFPRVECSARARFIAGSTAAMRRYVLLTRALVAITRIERAQGEERAQVEARAQGEQPKSAE